MFHRGRAVGVTQTRPVSILPGRAVSVTQGRAVNVTWEYKYPKEEASK